MKTSERIQQLYNKMRKELSSKDYDFHFHGNTILIITKKPAEYKKEID